MSRINLLQSSPPREKICGVYCFIHRDSGMKYVGSSKDCMTRKRKHRQSNHYFAVCARELGWDNFDFEILAKCLPEERFALERDFIVEKNSLFPHGYNMHADPTKTWAYVWTDEMREAQSERVKKRIAENPEARKIHSERINEFYKNNPEAREVASAKTKAYFAANPEVLEVISAKQKAHYAMNPEARKTVSVQMKVWYAENPHPRNRAVRQLSLTGKVITCHVSVSAASRSIGCVPASIRKSIPRGGTCGGFRWEYIQPKEGKV